MSVTNIKVLQKWSKIPKNIQKELMENVFCRKCGVTMIVDYSLHNDKLGIILIGKCKKCRSPISRFVESE